MDRTVKTENGKTTWKWVVRSFLIAFFLVVVTSVVMWVVVQEKTYCRSVLPGKRYNVRNRQYTLTHVPLKDRPLDKPVRILSEDHLDNMRHLYIDVSRLLDDLGIEWFTACGTLLGFTMEGTFLPYDDDVDLNVLWKHRHRCWSQQFTDCAWAMGLERIHLPFLSSFRRANVHGSVVRLRRRGSISPVLDIFFIKPIRDEDPFGDWGTVVGWKKGTVCDFKSSKTWPYKVLFPLKRTVVDGMDVVLPNDPDRKLRMQYGERYDQFHYPRNVLFAHEFAYLFTRYIWVRKKPTRKTV